MRSSKLLLLFVLAAVPAMSAELSMPADRQNALVEKYCAVCHTDPSSNGGLSLRGFDAAQAPPSLLAMMLSKLTGGVPLAVARQASSDAAAAALVEKRMKSGAMGASGLPIPDKAIIESLIHAFAVESAGATEWNVERHGETLTASTAREALSPYNSDEAEVYRVIASCKQSTRDGFMQLSWSPIPHGGVLAVSVDGARATQFSVEESEKKGYGNEIPFQGLASLALTNQPLPASSLTIDLFLAQTVRFSFANLPADARRALSPCF
jgi:hypothetical protein